MFKIIVIASFIKTLPSIAIGYYFMLKKFKRKSYANEWCEKVKDFF